MNKYIDVDKLIERLEDMKRAEYENCGGVNSKTGALQEVQELITSLQQEQPAMIQWTGNNLKEVIDFTGKSPRFEEWFKSWEEYENYVHSHNDILKLFCEDGSHYEVPVGAWIVKTPDGYNVPSIAKRIQQEQPELDIDTLREWSMRYAPDIRPCIEATAYHFWNMALNARKEE